MQTIPSSRRCFPALAALTLGWLLLVTGLCAQPSRTGIIQGRIYNPASKEYVRNAEIRLDGTNAEEGRQILVDAGIPEDKLRSEPTMLEAARAAVALAS
mgnify:CR=1 FL=1